MPFQKVFILLNNYTPRKKKLSKSYFSILKVNEHRHLKYYISMAGPDLLCVSSSKESQEVLRRIEREATFSYQTLTVSEESAANVLYINGTLIHRHVLEVPVSSQVGTINTYLLYQKQKSNGFFHSNSLKFVQIYPNEHQLILYSTYPQILSDKIDVPRQSLQFSELAKFSTGLTSCCVLLRRSKYIRNL